MCIDMQLSGNTFSNKKLCTILGVLLKSSLRYNEHLIFLPETLQVLWFSL